MRSVGWCCRRVLTALYYYYSFLARCAIDSRCNRMVWILYNDWGIWKSPAAASPSPCHEIPVSSSTGKVTKAKSDWSTLSSAWLTEIIQRLFPAAYSPLPYPPLPFLKQPSGLTPLSAPSIDEWLIEIVANNQLHCRMKFRRRAGESQLLLLLLILLRVSHLMKVVHFGFQSAGFMEMAFHTWLSDNHIFYAKVPTS